MKLTILQKQGLQKLARRFDFKFIILYGSRVAGKIKSDSDLDIAVLKNQKSAKKIDYVSVYELLQRLFPKFEVDLAFLDKSDSLFLYEVTINSQLLYGNPTKYTAFKCYTFRRYFDEIDLFKLQDVLLKKQQKLLLTL